MTATQPRFEVAVDSINNGSSAINKTCYVDSGMKGVTVDDFKFKYLSVLSVNYLFKVKTYDADRSVTVVQ